MNEDNDVALMSATHPDLSARASRLTYRLATTADERVDHEVDGQWLTLASGWNYRIVSTEELLRAMDWLDGHLDQLMASTPITWPKPELRLVRDTDAPTP